MTAVTTERSNRAIDVATDIAKAKFGTITAQHIYDELTRIRKELEREGPHFPHSVERDDVLDAIEDILQHSYHVIC